MTKITLHILFGCFAFFGFSQHNTVATGGDANGTNGSVSYSIGQIDYTNAQGTNGSVSQGVQQPYKFHLGLGEELVFDLSLFPNPTNEFVILKLENFTDDMKYELFDMKGKRIAENDIQSEETYIDMCAFAAGQYNLKLSNQNSNQTIKIIKH